MKKSAGKNIGNITADINKTVIKGTPLQNSIKPIDMYLINGNPDLLPKAKAIPIGKQKIKQKKEIMTTIKRDLQFFVEQDLMDYSMIVAIKQIDKVHEKISFESTAIHEDMYNSFKVWDGDKLYIVYVGIIDFLQGWTTGKRVAHVIKCMFAPKPISTVHPVVYAEQFENFFEKKFCTT